MVLGTFGYVVEAVSIFWLSALEPDDRPPVAAVAGAFAVGGALGIAMPIDPDAKPSHPGLVKGAMWLVVSASVAFQTRLTDRQRPMIAVVLGLGLGTMVLLVTARAWMRRRRIVGERRNETAGHP